MRYLSWLLKAALFFAVFVFALNNQGVVRVHGFFGSFFDAPLVLVLLAFLVLGLALGVALMLPLWLRARRAARTAVAAVAAAEADPNLSDTAAALRGTHLGPPPHGV